MNFIKFNQSFSLLYPKLDGGWSTHRNSFIESMEELCDRMFWEGFDRVQTGQVVHEEWEES